MPVTTTTYKGLTIINGTPSGTGGDLIQDNFITIADSLEDKVTLDADGNVPVYQVISVIKALSDGGTITWNANEGAVASVTIAGNRTLVMTNVKAGATYALKVNRSGAYTLTFGSEFKWAGGSAPSQSNTTSAIDLFSFISYDGSTLIGSILKGVA